MLFKKRLLISIEKGDAMNTDKIVVGFAGLPGSGVSFIVKSAAELGYFNVALGDVATKEAVESGLESTAQNIGKALLKLREQGGNMAVVQKCILKIDAQAASKVLIEDIRSPYETDALKAYFASFSLVAVYVSPQTRFERLFKCRPSDDPHGWEAFCAEGFALAQRWVG